MEENPSRQPPWIDPDPSKTTRREALSEALSRRDHLDVARAYSTLVERLEGDLSGPSDCAYCGTLIQACVRHLSGHVALEDFPAGYEALLSAINAFPSHRDTAGGAHGNHDEVEDERGAVPDPAASGEHDQAQRRDEK